jgi:acyl transferase domain-containing protein/3-hydroxymyristoyl/3-hydroxydecanoyl-(acyl carrier protein) dehydratase
MPAADRVAIVGMAARFPASGADLARFWADVAAAADRSREVPPSRWVLPPDACLDPHGPQPDAVYSTRGYFLDSFDPDPERWNVPRELLLGLDPLFHLILDVGHRAWRSVRTAGIDRRRAGVVLGNICLPTPGASELAREYLGGKVADALGLPREARRVHPLNRYIAGLPAGLLAKSLGLGGGTYTLDAACASSLYAIKLACDELLAGRADLMLAGGANGADSQYTQMGFCQLRALSPSGRCSPFDARADGLMVGEGAGVFVLKRLSDALRDRDTVYAVIAGAGLSNDMRGNLLAPDREGQLRAMRAAYKQAGWRPRDVDLIECHATGTPVGDAVEFDSLRELWGADGWRPGQCAIGSVKSTVGHLLTGAGAAAVAKVLLAFANKTRPPQANFEAPGPGLRYGGGPFRVLREAEPWDTPLLGEPRRAAVSGFGFGGVNAHLLLEEFVGQTLLLTPSPRQSVATGEGFAAEPPPEPVAVVGLAAHFGPWGDLRRFQEYVLGGGERPDPAPKRNGWGHADCDCPPGYYVEELTAPLDRFRIPPKELEEMLPQQLLMLQVAAAALDDSLASRARQRPEGDPQTGVFIGLGLDLNTTNFHLRWAAKALTSRPRAGLGSEEAILDSVSPPLTADRTMGALGSIAASRIARAFQFGGPSFTVCSEESSAGRAVALAVRALRAGELDRAVVGGVDLAGDPRALLPAPHDGALPGEGAAALVLKRLSDAERDGDRVYAVIRGVGSASGGPPGEAGPDAATYATSLIRACTDAVVDPATVEYLEATGDAAEAEALAALLAARDRPIPISLASVRGQVGHPGAASAAAGLVKACLALHHRILPPTLDDAPGALAAVSSRCHRSNQPRFWLADEGAPRRALVAAAGVDGSAVHVLLEEYASELAPVDAHPLGARPEAVFAVEADGLDGLLDGLVTLADFAARRIDRPVEWLAREWLRHSPQQPDRTRAVTFVARSPEELLEQAAFARESLQSRPETPIPDPATPDPRPALRDRVFYAPDPLGPAGKVAFVFPGSGNHFPGMGRDLSAHWPAVLRRQQAENRRLRSQYSPDRFWADTIPDDTTAKQYLFAQVALGTLTADLLTSLGVRSDAMIGQSLGESAGLFGLRVWTDRDEMLNRLGESTLFGPDLGPPFDSARRAFGLPAGTPVDWVSGVLAVPAEQVRAALRPGSQAYLLIITTPAECVVGGVREDVEELVRRFDAPYFPLTGVTLAHCEAGRPVEGPYRDLHTLPTTLPPGLTVYSGAWGKPYDPTPANCADSITDGLVGPIDFPAVVEAAYRDGVRFFVEAGPGNSATRMIEAILAGRPYLARAVCTPRQDSVSLVLRLVADLIAERGPADLSQLYSGEPHCAAHREPVPPPRRAVTVPVGQPPRELPPPPRPANRPAEREAVSVATAAYALSSAPEAEPFDGGLNGVAVEPEAELTTPVVRPVAVAWAAGLTPFVKAAVETQSAAAEAHDAFLRVQAGFTRAAAEAVQVQNELVRRLLGYEDEELPEPDPPAPFPDKEGGEGFFSPPPIGEGPREGLPASPPRSLDTAQCFEFARGRVGDVLGPLYAEADTFPTRVRLPDGPLMLVDRILTVEGEPRSLTSGRVVTEHHVHAGRWYLDAGRIPTCVAVEAGQADLFLSGFLGIDFQTRGLAVYRLLDAVVTFHRGLPRVGDTIRYDIHIDRFFNQSDTWLFRFRFEATVNGEPLMSMQNGVAGFFTAEALAAGQGIIHTKLDRQPMPGRKPADWRELVPVAPCELSREQVDALRGGDLAGAFGPDFARANLRSPVRLPGGMLRLLDRVTRLDPAGGRYGLGFIRAEYDVSPDDWFLTCHFVDDMVMPGTLMYECCLHTLRVLLMRMGWVGEDGEVACEPVPGVGSKLKCRGQVISSTKTVAYEVSVKELGYGPEPYCVADALMYADGKPIVEIADMTLRMTGLTREKLEAIWGSGMTGIGDRLSQSADPRSPNPDYDKRPALYDSSKILAFSNGDPSEAFGEPYRVFDRDRVIARLPGPPFQFLDRITAVTGEPFVLKAGAACEAQYDVPPDAWYFTANRSPRMPFSVLLEVALQPCGWLAAYCGSALTSDTDLKFRNLGGKATQFLPVTPNVGTLTVHATMTGVSKSAGMIIQHYDMQVSSRRGTVYEGTTYFGFFSAQALENQVGIAGAKVPALAGPAEAGVLPPDPPFPAPVLRMVDRIDGYQPAGGRAGLGLVQGSIRVDPSFWFFQAHFFQDPVWPGSLGIESFLQLLKYAAWKRWGGPGPAGWQTVSLGKQHEWVYRGQVVPADREVTVTLEVTAADDTARRLTADGFLLVDGRVIYQMTDFSLE